MEYKIIEVKTIKGFEIYERYWIDTNGILFKSIVRNKGKLKPLRMEVTNRGYGRFAFSKNINGKNVIKRTGAHRLVAMAFLENKDNKPEVNHKDENKLNNNVDNLEWMTSKENKEYSKETYKRLTKEQRALNSEQHQFVKDNYYTIGPKKLGEMFGLNRNTVSKYLIRDIIY